MGCSMLMMCFRRPSLIRLCRCEVSHRMSEFSPVLELSVGDPV